MKLKANTVVDYSPPTAEKQQRDRLSAAHPFGATGTHPCRRARGWRCHPSTVEDPGSGEAGATPESQQPSHCFIDKQHVSLNGAHQKAKTPAAEALVGVCYRKMNQQNR